MKAVKYLCFAAALATFASLGVGTGAQAGHHGFRQYYSNWNHYNTGNYYYRYYYYKPYEDYYGYRYNYCLYYPSRPQYYYYYNQYKSCYYGRCPVDYGGKPYYSWLSKEDQIPNQPLSQIPESKFPDPTKATSTPPIPESDPKAKEVVTMDLPPGDPPTGAQGLPVGN